MQLCKWSKAKRKFQQLLETSLQNRLDINITEYRNTSGFDIGRGWITFDGNEIVSIMIPSFYSKNFWFF